MLSISYCFVHLIVIFLFNHQESDACERTVARENVRYETQTYGEVVKYKRLWWWVTKTVINTHEVPITYLELVTECCADYIFTPFGCKPFCRRNCINGICVEPDRCACNPGYIKDRVDSFQCQPYCSSGCPNGACIRPQECTCNSGYTSQAVNGSRSCQPVCYPNCINGICTAPHYCQCIEGYKTNQNDSWICDAIVSDVRPTSTDYAIYDISFTSTTDLAEHTETQFYPIDTSTEFNPLDTSTELYPIDTSTEFYPLDTSTELYPLDTSTELYPLDTSTEFSVKINNNSLISMRILVGLGTIECNPPCINANCHTDNFCECFEGYLLAENTLTHCIPNCEPDCINGSCTSPNTCECFDGYFKVDNSEHRCIPSCQEACINGRCIDKNLCTCLSGYKPMNGSHNYCEPTCQPPCINSSCISSNSCQCWDDYEPIHGEFGNVCRPMCFLDCGNGSCNIQEGCDCNTGFEYDVEAETCVKIEFNVTPRSEMQRMPYVLIAVVSAVIFSCVVVVATILYFWIFRKRNEQPVDDQHFAVYSNLTFQNN